MRSIWNGSDLKLSKSKVTKKEVDMALSLIEKYTEKFGLQKFKNLYNDQLMEIIENKSKGKKVKVKKFDVKATPAKNLMAQLKASLEKKKKAS